MRKIAGIKRLLDYLHRYKTPLVLGLICVTLSNLAASISPLLLKYAIDHLAVQLSRDRLVYYSVWIMVFALLEAIFLFLMRKILIGMSRTIEYDLRNDLFAHFLGLSRTYYQQHKTGDLMSRATNDMNAVRMGLGPGIMYTANTVLRMGIVLVLMFRLSWRLSLCTLIIIPVVSLAVRYFGTLIHDRFEKVQESFSEISARVQENLAGVRVIRSYVQENSEIEEFRHLNQDYIQKNLKLIRLWGSFFPLLGALLGLGSVFVLWYGGREVIQGRLTLGGFAAFNAYLGMLSWPMIALGWVVNIVERATASMGRINQIFDSRSEIRDPGGEAVWSPESPDASPLPLRGELEFRRLNFSFEGIPVLRDVNLKIPAGSTVAIVGETGSGKTTLVNLLPRLYDCSEGEILLDGQSLRNYPLAALRASIGYVPQETFLFSQSLRENIALGAEQAAEEAIQQAAAQAQLTLDIAGFPKGFDTLIGERGITLSGGQQQRTAIARALLRNPRILILDCALSSVDTVTEERILQALKSVLTGRTSILISHRVSTVRFADQIIVLQNGCIVEQGTHDELLQKGGYYAGLYQKQLLEEELTEA
jgi:ATP-binding cassette, subfamily B, multidrug efflux pump